ncbi:MAG: site-2 protease family protein [Deltaproteobacteria bacterium]|nr:site-2 protease family protein [Deltaproteobacteria bacterium]
MSEIDVASANAFEDPLEERDYQEAIKLLLHPPKFQQKTALLLGTLGVFVAISAMRGSSSIVDLALLVGVLLFHELGHAIAMRAFGYSDVRIFFIPLFGAAASGRRRGVARWKQALVLLLGPLPGIVAGLVLGYLGASGSMHTLALMLIVVNALNLIPIEPLDGGQLFQVLLYSRNRHLEIIIRAITAALIVAGSVFYGEWLFVIIGAFMLITLGQRKRLLAEAELLRPLDLPSDPAALDDPQRRVLYRSLWKLLPAESQVKWRGQPKLQAGMMEQLLDASTTRTPSGGATAGLLATWLVGLALAAVALALVVPPQWQTFAHPTAQFSIEMPGPVTEITEPAPFVSSKWWSAEYGVTWTDVNDAEAWLEATRALLLERTKLVRDIKAQPNERRFDVRDGDVIRSMLLVTIGKRGYAVFAQPGETEHAKRVLDSFRAK